uniref:peptidylglycine monooxygenase n=1 Tax=Diabrotica virgifera virgifera TaxID=50390 RepID=A0A6P7H0C4_DIAVI
MERIRMLRFRVCFTLLCICGLTSCEIKKFPLLMPNVFPSRPELYICTPVRIVDDKSFYIVGFEPNATMNVAHHMLLFGCTTPGSDDEQWDCGEMAATETYGPLKKSTPCLDGNHVLYAWARDAKTLTLPHDVGFQVGKGTDIQYLVLQVHYTKKFSEGQTDNSGLFLMYTEEPQSKLAGVLLLGVGGIIPPKSQTYMETACELNENKTIHPFAYRTHTHSLGKVVSGYRVTRDRDGFDHWSLIGKRDPLTPQMFYPVFDDTPISQGDRLAARCTMDSSHRNRFTQVGPTNNDEMCNFYIMYYVKRDTPLRRKYCTTVGPPYYKWVLDKENDLNNIPDIEASSLD